MSRKVKLQEIVNEVAPIAFKEALGKANPKMKNKTNEELAAILGLSEHQYKHFMGLALGRAISECVEDKISRVLKQGDSVEVPHQFQVYVHTSEARKNEKGEPAKKLSVKTRRGLKRELN
jgi:hypothetical protein